MGGNATGGRVSKVNTLVTLGTVAVLAFAVALVAFAARPQVPPQWRPVAVFVGHVFLLVSGLLTIAFLLLYLGEWLSRSA